MLTYVARQLWRALVSVDWPVVEAQVLETRIDVHRGKYGSYVPVVRYRYEYGKVFEGDRIIFSGQTVGAGSQDEAQKFIDQFHVGMRIPIRVCPTNHALSVIEPGLDPRWWVPLVFALTFLLGGLSAVNDPSVSR